MQKGRPGAGAKGVSICVTLPSFKAVLIVQMMIL